MNGRRRASEQSSGRDDPEDGRCLYRRIPHRIREYGKRPFEEISVNIRYILGFERVVKKAIENFEKMGLKPVIYRAAVSVLTKETAY